MIKHCLLDAYHRRKHHVNGTWEFDDKCVLRFHPNDYIRNDYGQNWPHDVFLEARGGLVTGAPYDNGIATVDILPLFTYSGKRAWQDEAETIPKSPKFCASHLSIMTRMRVDRRMQYEARIKQQRAMNSNSDVKISMDRPTPNSHPWAPFDCVAVLNRVDSYDLKHNTLIRLSMVLTMNLDARIQKRSSLEPERKIRTRDIYRKWQDIRMLDPEERSTGDHGPYTWRRGMDPSYTESLHTPEIGTTNAAPQQMPTVPRQNGVLLSPANTTNTAPPQMPTVPHQNGDLPHPTDTTNAAPQQIRTMPHQNGVLPPPPGLSVLTPSWMKRKADDSHLADSTTPLEPAQKRQKTGAGADDEVNTDAGATPDNDPK